MNAAVSRLPPLPHFDLRRASRALSALLEDPDDLPQVFKLIDAISLTAPHRLLLGFCRTESGRRLLETRSDIVPLLADRGALRRLPEGTLGRAYLDFVESEGISAEGIRTASLEADAYRDRNKDFVYLKTRMRDTHDLWHAVTGYKGDVLGELSLLAFTLGQHWHTGVAMILGAALVKGWSTEVGSMMRDGYRRGRAAGWLPAQEWESLLSLPLATVRARLNIEPSPAYAPLRTADLRAQAILASR